MSEATDVNKPLTELCVGDILNIMKHVVPPVNDKLAIIETSLTNKLATAENRVTLLENVVRQNENKIETLSQIIVNMQTSSMLMKENRTLLFRDFQKMI